MDKVKAWIQASRLPSQSYIFFPILLGTGLYGFITGNQISLGYAVLAQVYGLFLQLYIVYANDYADADIDGANTTYNMFSGGSRVIPEGKLTRKELGRGAILVIVLNVVLGIVLLVTQTRPLALPLILASFLLLWMYSFPPVKLSYRGGGEFLQVLGVGVVLPLMGWTMQAGDLTGFPWHWLLFIIPLDIAASFTTTIPDEPSDRAANKLTFSARFGYQPIMVTVISLYLVGLVGFLVFSGFSFLVSGFGLLVPLALWLGLFFYLKDSAPGTKNCTLFVTFAVAVKVLWTAIAGVMTFFV
jgi:1,4-dihydroxy-2-naphthoate octaprenyltransferase